MKTRMQPYDALAVNHIFTLLLTLASQRPSIVKGNRCNGSGDTTMSRATKVCNVENALPPRPRRFRRSRVVFRAFMSMMLSMRMRTGYFDYELAEQPQLPRGAVIAARYVSR